MGNKYEDAEQESVRKTFAGEKNKLSKMTFNEKVDYIFSYYKLHILAVLLAVTAVVWGIHHALTYVRYEFYGLVVNSSQVDSNRQQDIHDYLKMDKHEGVSLSADVYTDERGDLAYGNRLDLLIATGQMDFAFTDEAGLEYLEESLFNNEEELEVSLELLKEYGTITGDRPAKDISGSPIQKYFGLEDDVHYLFFNPGELNQDKLKAFKKMLDEIEAGTIK